MRWLITRTPSTPKEEFLWETLGFVDSLWLSAVWIVVNGLWAGSTWFHHVK